MFFCLETKEPKIQEGFEEIFGDAKTAAVAYRSMLFFALPTSLKDLDHEG